MRTASGTGNAVVLLGPDLGLRQGLALAFAAVGIELVERPQAARFAVICGAGLDAESAALDALHALDAVLLVAAVRPTTPEAAAVPALARYWAQRLAPRVRVNALLLDPDKAGAAASELALYLLAHATLTTGATLALDGVPSL